MRLAIMQPYFLPYIGYFQLINAVDQFVIYDNIQFTKKGWINRNRILENGKDVMITLPIKKDSDYLDVRERELADSFEKEKNKILAKIKNNYFKAPYFNEIYPIVEEILNHTNINLFAFIYHSIEILNNYLGINTPLIISSQIDINHDLKSAEKVIAIVQAFEGTHYINPIGGIELYSKEFFFNKGIELNFLKTSPIEYQQFDNDFIPFLSIIDVMMFNSPEQIREMLDDYELE